MCNLYKCYTFFLPNCIVFSQSQSSIFFMYTNTLARLTMTTLSVSSVTWCLDVGFKAEIRIKEVKITHCDSHPL